MKSKRQLLTAVIASMIVLVVLSCVDSSKPKPPVINDPCYEDRPNNEMTSIIIYKDNITTADLDSLKKFGLKKTWSCPCDSNLQLWGDNIGVSIYGHDGLANNARNQPGGAGGVDDIIALGFNNISPNYYIRSGDTTTAIDTKYLDSVVNNYDSTHLIGVMDTGINYATNFWQNTNDPYSDDTTDNDNNGLVNDYNGWNFVNRNNKVGAVHHHGTFVTYLVERELQGKHGYGIVPMKVLDDNNKGKLTDMLCAMAYATKIPHLKTLNASLGYYGYPSKVLTTMIEKLKSKGILLVTAAGNADSSDICEVRKGKNPRDLANRNHKFYPAAYSKEYANVIAATTIKPSDPVVVCGPNQNYSDQYVNVGVMGDNGCDFEFKFKQRDTTYLRWGTSYAAPVATAYSFLRQLSLSSINEAQILSANETKTKQYKYELVPNSNQHIKRGVLIKQP